MRNWKRPASSRPPLKLIPASLANTLSSVSPPATEVVGIFLSSGLSGTYQSAVIAANEVCPDRIFPVDSRSFSFGTALLIREAVRMRNCRQYRAAEIAKAIALLARRIQLYAVIDTLKYLKMGGRLDSKTAFVGELLGIKPVAQLIDGKVEVVGKVRGDNAYIKALFKKLQQTPPDFQYGLCLRPCQRTGKAQCLPKLFCAPFADG